MLEEEIYKQAEFVCSLNPENVPEKARRAACDILLDSIGCIAVGISEMPQANLPDGQYPLLPDGTDHTSALFAYATAMVKHELDEGNQFAFGHPACHIVPTLLIECTERPLKFNMLLTVLIAAYEVTCRISSAVNLSPFVHVHGTAATVGSCAAACKIAGLGVQETYEAMLLALSLPQCSTWASAFNGDQIRNGYVGLSNLVGSGAYKMNRMGVYSSPETASAVWNKILGSGINLETLSCGLGEIWLIEKNYFKIHSACRYTHAFADMGLEFLKEGLSPNEIESVRIETYSAASKLKGQTARNAFAARFSIPVALSILLLRGELSPITVTDKNSAAEDVVSLARKIQVYENAKYSAMLPEIRFNRMVITLKDGAVFERSAGRTRGDYTLPFTRKELEDKFKKLTAGVYSGERQIRIIETIAAFEKDQYTDSLIKLLYK